MYLIIKINILEGDIMRDTKDKERCISIRPIGERQVNSVAKDINANGRIDQSETSLAYYKNFVAFGYNDASNTPNATGFSYSNDGGNTWVDTSGVPSIANNANRGDPVLSVDSKGIFYFAHLGAPLGTNNLFIQLSVGEINKSTAAINFGTPIRISDPAAINDDKPWVTVGPDFNRPKNESVYVVWTNLTTNRLRFSKLSVGPNPQVLIAPIDITTTGSPLGANVTVDQNGVIYVIYLDRTAAGVPGRAIRMVRSTDGGFTFTNPILVSNVTIAGTAVVSDGRFNRDVIQVTTAKNIRILEFPSVSIGPDGVIYVVWTDGRNQPTTGDDIYLAYSSNRGDNWNIIQATNNIAHEFFPSVAADCHGAHIQYARFNSSNGTIGIGDQTFALFKKTFSLQNGLGPESMVSTVFSRVLSNNPSTTGFGNLYMGDYNQVIIGPGNTLLHAWGDNRNDPNGNNPDVFFIQTRSMDPVGNSDPCECDKREKHHDHDRDWRENSNNIRNKFKPVNVFAPEINVRCKDKEHCHYEHRKRRYRCDYDMDC